MVVLAVCTQNSCEFFALNTSVFIEIKCCEYKMEVIFSVEEGGIQAAAEKLVVVEFAVAIEVCSSQ